MPGERGGRNWIGRRTRRRERYDIDGEDNSGGRNRIVRRGNANNNMLNRSV